MAAGAVPLPRRLFGMVAKIVLGVVLILAMTIASIGLVAGWAVADPPSFKGAVMAVVGAADPASDGYLFD